MRSEWLDHLTRLHSVPRRHKTKRKQVKHICYVLIGQVLTLTKKINKTISALVKSICKLSKLWLIFDGRALAHCLQWERASSLAEGKHHYHLPSLHSSQTFDGCKECQNGRWLLSGLVDIKV